MKLVYIDHCRYQWHSVVTIACDKEGKMVYYAPAFSNNDRYFSVWDLMPRSYKTLKGLLRAAKRKGIQVEK